LISFFTPIRDEKLGQPSIAQVFAWFVSPTNCNTKAGFSHFATRFFLVTGLPRAYATG
jgi:hypothetical protein